MLFNSYEKIIFKMLPPIFLNFSSTQTDLIKIDPSLEKDPK